MSETAAHAERDEADALDEARALKRRRFAIHAAVFAALANPTRHEMMHILCDGPRTPSELAALLNVSRPNVSQHLAVLQREGLVKRTRVDGQVLWDVVDRRLGEACTLFDEIVARQLTDKAHALDPAGGSHIG